MRMNWSSDQRLNLSNSAGSFTLGRIP